MIGLGKGAFLFSYFIAALSLVSVSTVDEAIELYNMGDSPGAIVALEEMISTGSLSFDEELRAWDRLGSSYYAMGNSSAASEAYTELLRLDVYYDFSPRANPRLQALLNSVRDDIMASAMVRSEPAGAFVTLDGQLMGVTPIMLDGLLGGNVYEVDVYQVGYATEFYTLIAQPGYSHMLQFDLSILPDQASVAVAVNTDQIAAENQGVQPAVQTSESTETQENIGNLNSDELIASPFETAGQTGTSEDEQVQVAEGINAETIQTPPQSTADLLAMLSGGGGIDMAALNNSGALTSGGGTAIGLAGSTGSRSGIVASGVAAQAEAMGREIMVFSDISSLSTPTVSGSESYSSRSADEIAELVSEKRGSVMYVYNKHLRTDPLLMGRVDVAMIIHPSGRVSDVEIVGSNMYNRAFELELVSSIEQWRFGSVDSSEGPLPIQLPFSFNP
ncbi:MAG: AgmX/PglI C-terminal domain-containing protein [Candidatus Fermentibacteria bacterium]|nr:AgmX/PglI C-terminal domain-containing protein [Candidatus Fermentibacteria bacterium]